MQISKKLHILSAVALLSFGFILNEELEKNKIACFC